MRKPTPKRQRIRRGLILGAFLLFPLIINYFSPYLIIVGASQGIVNGSLLVFSAMLLASLFVGRAWCGWLCPAGGLQEACTAVNNREANRRFDCLKWLIWLPWMAAITGLFIAAGGIRQVNPFFMIETGLSITEAAGFIIYYFVVGMIFILPLFFGQRAFCHYACWMAPFMMIGRKLRNLGRWPALRLQAQPAECSDCKLCERNCPMSLPVHQLVHAPSMEHSECILCGNCVDTCAKGVIRYQFNR